MYEIIFYEDESGHCPIQLFLDDLNERAKRDKDARNLFDKIQYCLDRLEVQGTRGGSKFTKQIEGKLWELRPDDHRIFFFGWNGKHMMLLHIFRKESQKTPPREIAIAEKRMEDWIRRYGK